MDNADSNIEVVRTMCDEDLSAMNSRLHSLSNDWVGIEKEVQDNFERIKEGEGSLRKVEDDVLDLKKCWNEQITISAQV